MTVSGDSEIDGSKEIRLAESAEAVAGALVDLANHDLRVAQQLASLFLVIATEAGRTKRFAKALTDALDGAPPREVELTRRKPAASSRRGSTSRGRNRRAAGVLDPFQVYASSGEAGLRSDLSRLELELLRDIVAEHAMDPDRLAMKWKDPSRVVDRIVERVVARSAKGEAFRSVPGIE